MARRPNVTPPTTPPLTTITFRREEYRRLKFNLPGPSGQLGGYGRFENKLVRWTHRRTLRVSLDAKHLERMIRYCQRYGPGGPNKRIRDACIPALQRIGIDLCC